MSVYVSDVTEIGRILKGDKQTSIVLYCNGPFCGKSKRLAEELVAAGSAGSRSVRKPITFRMDVAADLLAT